MAVLTPDELILLARENEQIARRLFEIEVQVMNLETLGAFMQTLSTLIVSRFELDGLWWVFSDIEMNQGLLAYLQDAPVSVPVLQVPTVELVKVLGNGDLPVLQNEPTGRGLLYPLDWHARFGSLAWLPVTLERRVVGALVLASESAQRYHPDMDSFFLQQLAVRASTGLNIMWVREQLRQLATRDPLTGLRNRRELDALLAREISRAVRYGEPLSLMFMDVDDFKAVNDTYGHDAGDACLCHVARALSGTLRNEDVVFRFAGDEFVVLLPNQAEATARAVAQRLMTSIQDQPLLHASRHIPMGVSIGLASLNPASPVDGGQLLHLADEDLYRIKQRRKG